MKRSFASAGLLLLLTPLLAGCLGDYAASGECDDLANELSPVIEKSIGSAPSIDSAWGDGGMMPWCRIDFSTTKEYAPDVERLSALKSEVEAGIADWSSGVVVTIHTGNDRSIEVLSPGTELNPTTGSTVLARPLMGLCCLGSGSRDDTGLSGHRADTSRGRPDRLSDHHPVTGVRIQGI